MALTDVLPVSSVCEWHSAHPMLSNCLAPRAIDAAPPGVVAEGIGGPRKRMKSANFSTSLSVRSAVLMPVLPVTSLGMGACWQAAFCSRSFSNISFEIPISTL